MYDAGDDLESVDKCILSHISMDVPRSWWLNVHVGLVQGEKQMKDTEIDRFRYFLKDHVRLTIDFRRTDQSMGIAPPPLEKPYSEDAERIDLIRPDQWTRIQNIPLTAAFKNRKSHRVFKKEPLNLEEISFLLWATQGIRQAAGPGTALRTVPSAGARHSFETYLAVLNVEGLQKGLYRYLPVEHQLIFEHADPDLNRNISEAAYGQSFVGRSSLAFLWTSIPYRMEWRYHTAAHKVIAIDAGHVCQNLYLAVEAVGAGTCAIAAYNQELMDDLIHVDGKDEFCVYMAAVGKI